jgi:hypothetical protein
VFAVPACVNLEEACRDETGHKVPFPAATGPRLHGRDLGATQAITIFALTEKGDAAEPLARSLFRQRTG